MSKKTSEFSKVREAVEQFVEDCGIDSDVVSVRLSQNIKKRKQGIPLEFTFRVRTLVAPLQMIDGAWYVAAVPSELKDDLLVIEGVHCPGIGSYELTITSGGFMMHDVSLENLSNILQTVKGDSVFQAKVDDLNNIEMEPAQIDQTTLLNLAQIAGGGAVADDDAGAPLGVTTLVPNGGTETSPDVT